MSQTDFHTRLARLTPREKGQASVAPTPPRARNRRERLHVALLHLAQGGITGSYAYSPLFRAMARIGLTPKPLHYWSWAGLIVFFMALAVFIAALAIVLSLVAGQMPRPVRSMIASGPTVFFTGAFVLSVIFAAIHKVQARQIGLPRWRDL